MTIGDVLYMRGEVLHALEKAAEEGPAPIMERHGLSADSDPADVKKAMALMDPEDAIKLAYEYIGELAVSELDDVKLVIDARVDAYTDGFVKKCMDLGMDDGDIVKFAQATGGWSVPTGAIPRVAAGAIRQRMGDEAPVLSSTSQLINKATGGGALGTIADLGSYAIPFVGDARMVYDAGSDFANMFGKDLNWKQRLGYGLSGLGNAALGIGGALAGAFTGGLGSSAVTAIGKPIMKGLKWLFGAKKVLPAAAKAKKLLTPMAKAIGAPAQKAYGMINRGLQASPQAMRAAQFMNRNRGKITMAAIPGMIGGGMMTQGGMTPGKQLYNQYGQMQQMQQNPQMMMQQGYGNSFGAGQQQPMQQGPMQQNQSYMGLG